MKVVTDNAGNASAAKVTKDYANLAALDVDVIGSQEVTDRAHIIAHVPGMTGIQLHTQPNSAHVALNIRDGLPFSDVQLKKLNKLTWVGRLVAGARKSGKSKIKYILSADVDGHRVGVTHLVPSWTKKRCILARRLAKKQVAGCVEWFNAGGDALLMDGNGPADHPVFAPLRAVAVPYAKGKSHGIERDIIWVRKGAASAVTVDALTSSSDHPPVVADITWTKSAPRPQHAPKPKPKHHPTPEAAMSGYHRADTKSQWFQDKYPGAVMTPNCVILHTTESMSWPTYSGGSVAPNYTARPNFAKKRLDWRQHFPDERSARALENHAGGVETNTLNVVQVELVGTCDPTHAKTWAGRRADRDYIYWPEAPAWALREVGRFLADQAKRHGTKLVAPKPFEAYPASYGADNGVRMTDREWANFYGIAGHQHVPENDHGDPGNIDIDRILGYATGKPATKPPKKPAPKPAPTPAPPPAPRPAPRPKLERDTIANAATIADRAAKHGNKRRESKWRSLWRTMLGRSK